MKVFHTDWVTTPEGWEDTLQVNVIATGLLALLAIPKLAATADLAGNDSFKPHLVIVASEGNSYPITFAYMLSDHVVSYSA